MSLRPNIVLLSEAKTTSVAGHGKRAGTYFEGQGYHESGSEMAGATHPPNCAKQNKQK
jgi:hypothetical protein